VKTNRTMAKKGSRGSAAPKPVRVLSAEVPSQDIVDRIANAALYLLEKKGPTRVNMRAVADSVGVTAMAIYYHFPNKAALLDSVTRREFNQFIEKLVVPKTDRSIDTALKHVVNAYLDFYLERPRVFQYVFAEPRPNAWRYPEDFRSAQSSAISQIGSALKTAMSTGALAPDDAWEIALQVWTHAHGYVALHQAGHLNLSDRDFRALVHRAFGRLLGGLRTAKPVP
jgi:AcrR family transcriptional regulator